MERFFRYAFKIWGILVLVLALAACDPLANPYSADAYKQATSLKARSLQLIQNGTQPYSSHASTSDALLLSISESYEFARGRGRKNADEAAKQWAIIRDPNGGSVADFIRQWEEQGIMSRYFVDEFGKLISKQFDEII
ncbi:hypothetical protein JMM59_22515, partial [Rhodovulum sulfidophilum]|uniref:hypothetical protein n=1 Tax=Rhodovulum sulfidophilum TaxID=35806 RepID=UPI001924FED0